MLIVWFGFRVVRDARASGVRALAGGHCAPHLVHSGAMLYMFLAIGPVAGDGGHGRHERHGIDADAELPDARVRLRARPDRLQHLGSRPALGQALQPRQHADRRWPGSSGTAAPAMAGAEPAAPRSPASRPRKSARPRPARRPAGTASRSTSARTPPGAARKAVPCAAGGPGRPVPAVARGHRRLPGRDGRRDGVHAADRDMSRTSDMAGTGGGNSRGNPASRGAASTTGCRTLFPWTS